MKSILVCISLVCGMTLHADDVQKVEVLDEQTRLNLSNELLAIAQSVVTQAGSALAPMVNQAATSLGSMVTTAIGSFAQNLLSNAQATFGDVDFKNNVTIGDEPTDLLTVVANAQFVNNVIHGGNTTLGDDLTCVTKVIGTLNGEFPLYKVISTNFLTATPLCTISFDGPMQSAMVKISAVSSEGAFRKTFFIRSTDLAGSREMESFNGGADMPALMSSFLATGNDISIQGLASVPLTNMVVLIEVLPAANSRIIAIS